VARGAPLQEDAVPAGLLRRERVGLESLLQRVSGRLGGSTARNGERSKQQRQDEGVDHSADL
jgi:hypothetical protein